MFRFIRRLFWSKNAIEFIAVDRNKKKGKILSIQFKSGQRVNYTCNKGSWRSNGKFVNKKQQAAIKVALKIIGRKKFWRRP